MKKIKLLISFFLSFIAIGYCQSQTIEENLNTIFNKRDMLELSRYYPQIKDSISSSVDIVCKTFLAIAYNKPEEVCILMNEMNQKYPDQLGSLSMISLWAHELYNLGEYQHASDLLHSILEQLKAQNIPQEYMSHLIEHQKINNSLSKEAKLNIIGIQQESVIPILRKEDDPYIYSKVIINGKQAEAFYDTGSITVVDENFIKENNVRILVDNIKITDGLKNISTENKFGIIDTLIVGDFKCANVPCYIMNVEQVECDILIGLDLLRHFSELRLYPKRNEIVLSQMKSAQKKPHNYMIWGKASYIECMFENEKQTFLLDTGNNHEGIYRPYYFEAYRNRFTNDENPVQTAGKIRIYQLNPFDLRFNDSIKTMTDFFLFENGDLVTTIVNEEFPHGNIGVRFINLWSEFILNFDNMYYQVK